MIPVQNAMAKASEAAQASGLSGGLTFILQIPSISLDLGNSSGGNILCLVAERVRHRTILSKIDQSLRDASTYLHYGRKFRDG